MNEGNERARWIKMSAQLQQGGEGGHMNEGKERARWINMSAQLRQGEECRMMHASGMKCVWQGGEGGITSARPGAGCIRIQVESKSAQSRRNQAGP